MNLRSVYEQTFVQILFFARYEPGYICFDSNLNGFTAYTHTHTHTHTYVLQATPVTGQCGETRKAQQQGAAQPWVRGHSRGMRDNNDCFPFISSLPFSFCFNGTLPQRLGH